MTTHTPRTPPNPPAPGAPNSTPSEGPPTGTKVMALLFCFVCAALAAVIALSIARHYGADSLIAIGWGAGTFVGAFYLVQNILEKFGQL